MTCVHPTCNFFCDEIRKWTSVQPRLVLTFGQWFTWHVSAQAKTCQMKRRVLWPSFLIQCPAFCRANSVANTSVKTSWFFHLTVTTRSGGPSSYTTWSTHNSTSLKLTTTGRFGTGPPSVQAVRRSKTGPSFFWFVSSCSSCFSPSRSVKDVIYLGLRGFNILIIERIEFGGRGLPLGVRTLLRAFAEAARRRIFEAFL